MITVSSLSLSYGPQTIAEDVSFTVLPHQRIGIVGPNGAGKSTLLALIAGLQQPDRGIISIAQQYRLAYMPQEVVLASNLSVLDETVQACGAVADTQAELSALEQHIEGGVYTQETLERYQELHTALQQMEPDVLRARAQRLLLGLGFHEKQLHEPTSSLSTGWKMRIVLAKLLLQKADFYLFDEPTNHLDIGAKDWFVSFLKKASFGFMLVSHDRYIHDAVCDQILELECGRINWYTGNYTLYQERKERKRIALEQAYALQQRDIKQKQQTIDRFRAKASKAKMAHSMEKALDRVERIELPPSPKTVNFSFPSLQRSGKLALRVHNLGFSFDQNPIFSGCSFQVERGEKVAIVAPNGGGKSTLFNLIAGRLPMQEGAVSFGYNVTYALFDQDQQAALNPEATIYQTIIEHCPEVTPQTVRTFLGSFLFGAQEIEKKIGVLSGGERNRVGMVKVLLKNANMLLLDEPTNHLDIPSKDMLLKALQHYQGTILFVSHDRSFVNGLASHIIELTSRGCHSYMGNYDDFCLTKQQIIDQESVPIKNEKIRVAERTTSQTDKERQRRCRALERSIAKAEKAIVTVQDSFADLTYDSPSYQDAVQKLLTLEQELASLMEEWEQYA